MIQSDLAQWNEFSAYTGTTQQAQVVPDPWITLRSS